MGEGHRASLVTVSLLSSLDTTGRTSTPLGGINNVFGGFDSHALPPVNFPHNKSVPTCLLPQLALQYVYDPQLDLPTRGGT